MSSRRIIMVALFSLFAVLIISFSAHARKSMVYVLGFHDCYFCHNLHGTGGGVIPAGTAEAVCLSCHDPGASGATKKATVHTDSSTFSETCTTCHDPHVFPNNWQQGENLSAIGSTYNNSTSGSGLGTINTPNSGIRNVVFESRGTDPASDTVYNSFADNDQDQDGVYDGICEVCHTGTSHHTNSAPDPDHYTGETCTRCHSHTKNFKGEGACTTCHSQSKGSAPYIFRQVTKGTGTGGDFDIVTSGNKSRHVFNSTGSDPTNFDCIVCHAEGDITSSGTSIKTTSEHNDLDVSIPDSPYFKTIGLRNVDSTENPGVANVDFWRWPKVASGTINTPSNEDYANMDLFCMSCHDADGASGVAVNAGSDGIAVSPSAALANKPFSHLDNLDQDGYNAGSVTPDAAGNVLWDTQSECTSGANDLSPYGFVWTGSACIMPRRAVLDVHGQFDPSNPSHHAVREARYNDNQNSYYCLNTNISSRNCDPPTYYWAPGIDACVDTSKDQSTCTGSGLTWTLGWGPGAWEAYTPKGQASDLKTLRETATLHCADCHTVDDNAHTGANNFMLTVSTIDGTCWQCHNKLDNYSDTKSLDSRFDHSRDGNVFGSNGSLLDPSSSGGNCLNCHGGSHYDGYGAIHGMPAGNDPRTAGQTPSVTSGRYRFIGGSYLSPTADGDFTSGGATINCYADASIASQPWATCSKHTGIAGTSTAQYPRGTSY